MKLVVLDPGHFHAALLQKTMYPDVDATVHVYAEEGPELADYLQKIESYNARRDRSDCVAHGRPCRPRFPRSLQRGPGRRRRRHRRQQPAQDRIHRRARSMPACTCWPTSRWPSTPRASTSLRRGVRRRRRTGVLLYDIMTERHEITTMLQKAFSRIPSVFGELLPGTEQDPAVVKESVHHFSKLVSGAPIKRPAWFFDVAQQGEGLVDITTHLVDLVQWECFPGEILDFDADIRILGAKRWPTGISPAQFAQVTQLSSYPDYLRKDVQRTAACTSTPTARSTTGSRACTRRCACCGISRRLRARATRTTR